MNNCAADSGGKIFYKLQIKGTNKANNLIKHKLCNTACFVSENSLCCQQIFQHSARVSVSVFYFSVYILYKKMDFKKNSIKY